MAMHTDKVTDTGNIVTNFGSDNSITFIQQSPTKSSSKNYLDFPYSCIECKVGFKNHWGLEKHKYKHHPVKGESNDNVNNAPKTFVKILNMDKPQS